MWRTRPVVLARDEQSPECGGGGGEGGVGRARSLTDDDLEELKGCVDLGFGFSYEEIPELCGTLPVLELYYSMSQRFLDDKQSSPPQAASPPAVPSSPAPPAIANWKISSPGWYEALDLCLCLVVLDLCGKVYMFVLDGALAGDSSDEVKARLKYWAQAVACTVKLCS